MKKIKYSEWVKETAFTLVLMSFSVCFHVLVGDKITEIPLIVIWFLFFSFFIFKTTLNYSIKNTLKMIILFGYLFRLVFLLVSNYSQILPFKEADSLTFFQRALEYYSGDFSKTWTNYPYVLLICFKIFGPNKLLSSYVNILFWFCGVKIIIALFEENRNDSTGITLGLLLWCLFPTWIVWTTALLRESLMALSIFLSIFFLNKWMNGKGLLFIVFSCLVVIPGIWLHSGVVCQILVIVFTCFFWNKEEQKWKITIWKVLFLTCFCILLVLFRKQILSIFPYFPNDISFDMLTNSGNEEIYKVGNLDYAPLNIHIDSWKEFFLYETKKLFMFWFSPFVGTWKNPIYFLVFISNVVPILLVLFVLVFKAFKKKINHGIISAIIGILLFSICYSIGTINAGTAIRHRDMFLPLWIFALSFIDEGEKS